ncbi:hypothetical protein BH20ACT23_BH20ACT23_23790 [soil metagenome]
MTSIQTAAVGAGVLISGVAVFQAALALGLPLGEATLGGRAPTMEGVLTGWFRLVPAISATVLLGAAWIVLVRAGVVGSGALGDVLVLRMTWGLVGFLALNTVGSWPHLTRSSAGSWVRSP